MGASQSKKEQQLLKSAIPQDQTIKLIGGDTYTGFSV